MKNEQITDSFLLSIGSIYSIVNIEDILGIVILIVQIIWFSLKIYLKIKSMISDGEITDDEEEIIKTDLTNLRKENSHNDTEK